MLILEFLKYGVFIVGAIMFVGALMRAKKNADDEKGDFMKIAAPWVSFAVALMLAAFGLHLLEQVANGIPAGSTIAEGSNIVDGVLKLISKDIQGKLTTIK